MNIDIYYLYKAILEGFVLGLSNTFACIGVCAPIFILFVISQEGRPWVPVVKFLIGRYIAYVLTGLLAGFSGLLMSHVVHSTVFD